VYTRGIINISLEKQKDSVSTFSTIPMPIYMTILCTQNTFKIDPKKQRQGPKKEKLIFPSIAH